MILALLLSLAPAFEHSVARSVPLADLFVDASATGCATATGSAVAPFCTVGEAVAVAVDGDRIFIAPGTYVENLDIDDDVTLIGSDGAAVTTIDGGANGTVVTITGFSVVQLRGLTIRNGLGVGAGGVDARGVIDIVDSVVENNRGTGALAGGGITSSGILTLDRTQVLRNSTTGAFSAGGIFGEPVSNVTIRRSTIAGNSMGSTYLGAGALLVDFGDITIENTTISGNSSQANRGAAVIAYVSDLTIRNSTISDNDGGGVWFYEYGASGQMYSASCENSTITGNRGVLLPGGIDCYGGPFEVRNSIVAANTSAQGPSDIVGPFVSLGHNLIGDSAGSFGFVHGVNGDLVGTTQAPLDPMLAPLASNGGPSPTLAPLAVSPVIDAGDVATFLPRDQRGVPRPAGATDIGAHERTVASLTSGCAPVPNSTGAFGRLELTADLDVTSNEAHLTMLDLPTESFGYFLTSRMQGSVAQPGGSQGVLCLGGAVGRYVGPGQIMASDAAGTIALRIDLTQHPTPTGLISVQAGETWFFQGWHRDAAGGAATSNFTLGVGATFL